VQDEDLSDPLEKWIREGGNPTPDPEAERAAVDETIAAIHRKVGGHTVEALLELFGHEIRTPLAVIEGSATLLLDDEDDLTSEHVEVVRRIHRNAVLALLLLDRLATIRLVESGSLALRTVPTEVPALVRECAQGLHEAVLGTRPLVIRDDVAGPAVCDVDPNRIHQVVFNLLANAALNTPPEAAVLIRIATEEGVLRLEVRDEGHGVAPDDTERLFEKFPRLDAARQGPGVGLYVSRGIARAHGGDLWAEPSPKKTGGIFVFTLPLRDPSG
jgi:signal transduction histidine kinase